MPTRLVFSIALRSENFMNRSKKIFVGAVVIFAIFLAVVSYDIGSRTTFPGSKPQLRERLKDQYLEKDSLPKSTIDTLHR